jgi:hypothetical protein
MNITVKSRRSGEGATAATAGMAVGAPPRDAPQSPQNRLSAGLLPPHALHCHGIGVPQSPQNFLLFSTVAPHRGHIMRAPNRLKRPASYCALALSVYGSSQVNKGAALWTRRDVAYIAEA